MFRGNFDIFGKYPQNQRYEFNIHISAKTYEILQSSHIQLNSACDHFGKVVFTLTFLLNIMVNYILIIMCDVILVMAENQES